MGSNFSLSSKDIIKNWEKEMKGKELIFIEQNCVPVDILGSTHALSLNSHNNFLVISILLRGKIKTQRNLASCLRSYS